MKTLIYKPIDKIEIEEYVADDFLTDPDEDYKEIFEGFTERINQPIKINSIRDTLDKLEQNGASHVTIHYHGDHRAYELYGQHVSIASQEEIDIYKRKDDEYRIKFLKDKIDNLIKEKELYENAIKKIIFDQK